VSYATATPLNNVSAEYTMPGGANAEIRVEVIVQLLQSSDPNGCADDIHTPPQSR